MGSGRASVRKAIAMTGVVSAGFLIDDGMQDSLVAVLDHVQESCLVHLGLRQRCYLCI